MAKKKDRVTEIISNFAGELRKDIPVDKILLFGSYAKGIAVRNSDIDVIVVSPYFRKGKYITHIQYLFRKAAKVSSLLEPIPAVPEDIKRLDKRTFLGQILKHAKVYNFS